ncbi:MAG: hypothetical protein ABII18_04270 [bacterium]|nr:hypothetical protein [bacterium]
MIGSSLTPGATTGILTNLCSPFLVMPNRSDMLRPTDNKLSPGEARIISDSSLTQMQWALLAQREPELVRHYLDRPLENTILRDILTASQGLPKEPSNASASANDLVLAADFNACHPSVNLTAFDEPALQAFFASQATLKNSTVRLVFNPLTQEYTLEWHRPRSPESVTESLFHGAWKFSSVIKEAQGALALADALTNPRLIDRVEDGARVLLIPERTKLTQPQIVRMQKQPGTHDRAEFWFPRRGQLTRKGSAVSLILPNVNERFDVDALVDKIIDDAKETAARGLQPALALDVDGTLIDLREYVIQLFNEWVNTLEDADRRHILDMARTKNTQEMRAWDLPTLITDNFGITKESVIASAKEFHRVNFYDADRRVFAPTVPGMIQLIKVLQDRAKAEGINLATVFVTNRSDQDDMMSDGKSSVEVCMTRLGIWNEHSHLSRHTGAPLDWSVEAFAASGGGAHEPPKWIKVKAFRDGHPNIWFVAVFDNAPAHLNGYEKYFGHNVIKVHIEGDLPPGSPPVNNGAFVINPFQLVSALEMLGLYASPT